MAKSSRRSFLLSSGAAVASAAGIAALGRPARASAPGATTTIDVISDVQGGFSNLNDYAMKSLNSQPTPAEALVINGDLVPDGGQGTWDQFNAALAATPHVSGNVTPTIGNHEFYGYEGSSVYLSRFLANAGRPTVWTERVVSGVPIIVVGSEGYDYAARTGDGPFVEFSPQQLQWLRGRLQDWSRSGVPVLVFSHQVLPNSVSGTDLSFYLNDYGEYLGEFLSILGEHSNIALFTSHTHWPLDLPDWTVSYARPEVKNPIPVFNTGAVVNAYGPNGSGGETPLPGTHCSGLRVHVKGSTVTVEAWDFVANNKIKESVLQLGRNSGIPSGSSGIPFGF